MRVMVLILGFMTMPAHANIQSQLMKAYESFGYKGNVSGSSSFKDQQAGYYTGGGLYARKPVASSQMASLHLPKVEMGCGGIDAYMGGMSYISKAEFVKLLKQIGGSTTAYAFQLGLQTVSPQIKSTLDQLQSIAQDINALNVNSCEAGATLVGSVWPRTEASQQMVCRSMGSGLGAVSDYAAARQGCGTGGKRDEFYGRNGKEQFEDVKPHNVNLAWKALRKSTVASDKSLREFFMSVSGTIIITAKGNERPKVTYLPSKATSATFLNALLRGEEGAPIYVCDEAESCLAPTNSTHKLSSQDALYSKISSTLNGIRDKVKANGQLTQSEMDLIASTPIPIMKILLVELMYRGGNTILSLDMYAEVIAHDVLMSHLSAVLDEVESGLRAFDVDEGTLQSFRTDVREVRKRLLDEKSQLYKRVLEATRAVEHTLLIEKKAQQDFTNQVRGY